MQNQNTAILVGNLGNDPEIKNFGNHTKMSFSLATSNKIKKKDGEEIDLTQWHYIVCWNKRFIDLLSEVKKGDRVYIHGEIQYSKWTDKNGVDKVSTNINAGIMGILKQKESNSESAFDKHDKESNLESAKIPNETPTYDVDSDVNDSDIKDNEAVDPF